MKSLPLILYVAPFGPLYDDWDDTRFFKAMQKMNLSPGKTVGKMSRGELFKFQTAFAVAHQPALYLIDEATAGMDPVFRIDYFKMLQEIIAEENASILMTSHIQDEIQRKMDFVGIMEDGKLGEAGKSLVIEEYLSGVEISILAAVSVAPNDKCGQSYGDNVTIVPFVTARDHKRLLDGAKGPNTGGMGAIAPVQDVTSEQLDLFNKNILQPTLKGMIEEKMDYRGFIFFGIMLTKDGPKLLEYNVRLGDPETQAVLPLMDFDFAAMCKSITEGTVKNFDFKWKKGFVCAPVIVSEGYPGSYKKGCVMTVNKAALADVDATMYVAGAQFDENENVLKTSGGRVVAVSAYADSFDEAWKKAYKGIDAVCFEGMFYRKDIGLPGAAESGEL